MSKIPLLLDDDLLRAAEILEEDLAHLRAAHVAAPSNERELRRLRLERIRIARRFRTLVGRL